MTCRQRISRVPVVTCCLFFFFQAEDGIRDYKVTGVQTCALPISDRRRVRRRRLLTSVVGAMLVVAGGYGIWGLPPWERSGEGRGGEEGRFWGGADHLKKKKKNNNSAKAGDRHGRVRHETRRYLPA